MPGKNFCDFDIVKNNITIKIALTYTKKLITYLATPSKKWDTAKLPHF